MNPFITSIFTPRGVGVVVPPDPDPDPGWPTYDDYKVGIFKVVDNYVGGKLSANTGISYDKNRRFIHSSITPLSSGYLKVFNEAYEYQGEIPIKALQGHTYNPNNDTFMVWGNDLVTYSYDGTLLNTQLDFNPYGDGTTSGSLGYNDIDDELAVTSDGGLDVLIFKKSGSDWVLDRSLGNGDAYEGVCFDEDRDCYWYNRPTDIVQISKTGTFIKAIPQVAETINSNEGLVYNPNRKTHYLNADKGYHGGITDGNRCTELWPGFYE